MRPFLWAAWRRLVWLATGDCGHGCQFAPLYGCVVSEAGCPVHDTRRMLEV